MRLFKCLLFLMLFFVTVCFAGRTTITTPEAEKAKKIKQVSETNDILTRTIKDKDTSDLRDLVKQMLE